MVELSLELKIRLGLDNDPLKSLLQSLHTCLCFLTKLSDTLVLPLAPQTLLLCLVHLKTATCQMWYPVLFSHMKDIKSNLISFCIIHTNIWQRFNIRSPLSIISTKLILTAKENVTISICLQCECQMRFSEFLLDNAFSETFTVNFICIFVLSFFIIYSIIGNLFLYSIFYYCLLKW